MHVTIDVSNVPFEVCVRWYDEKGRPTHMKNFKPECFEALKEAILKGK